jgi:hypothetical protein
MIMHINCIMLPKHYVKNHCCKTFECCVFVFFFFSDENAKTKTQKTIDVENV